MAHLTQIEREIISESCAGITLAIFVRWFALNVNTLRLDYRTVGLYWRMELDRVGKQYPDL